MCSGISLSLGKADNQHSGYHRHRTEKVNLVCAVISSVRRAAEYMLNSFAECLTAFSPWFPVTSIPSYQIKLKAFRIS